MRGNAVLLTIGAVLLIVGMIGLLGLIWGWGAAKELEGIKALKGEDTPLWFYLLGFFVLALPVGLIVVGGALVAIALGFLEIG